jgi:hypothetical protein
MRNNNSGAVFAAPRARAGSRSRVCALVTAGAVTLGALMGAVPANAAPIVGVQTAAPVFTPTVTMLGWDSETGYGMDEWRADFTVRVPKGQIPSKIEYNYNLHQPNNWNNLNQVSNAQTDVGQAWGIQHVQHDGDADILYITARADASVQSVSSDVTLPTNIRVTISGTPYVATFDMTDKAMTNGTPTVLNAWDTTTSGLFGYIPPNSQAGWGNVIKDGGNTVLKGANFHVDAVNGNRKTSLGCDITDSVYYQFVRGDNGAPASITPTPRLISIPNHTSGVKGILLNELGNFQLDDPGYYKLVIWPQTRSSLSSAPQDCSLISRDPAKTAGSQVGSVYWHMPSSVAPSDAPVVVTSPVAGSTSTSPRPVFSGTGEPGATITVKDQNGKTIATTTVGPDGNWSVTPTNDLPNGTTNVTVNQTTPNGTTSTNVSFDQKADAPVVVTSPAAGSTSTSPRPVFSGTGAPGATITVKDEGGKTIGSTTAGPDGNWSVTPTADLPNGTTNVTVSQTTPNGTTSTNVSFDQKVAAPVIPVTVTAPAINAVVSTTTPTFSGTGAPGATIEVKGNSGKVIASTTVKPDGTWSVQSDLVLTDGAYVATAVQTAGSNVTQAPIRYTIKSTEQPSQPVTPVVVTGPALDAVVRVATPTFTGTGEPGATVQVKGNSGKVIATATVKSDGTWSAVSALTLTPGAYIATAVQTAGTDVTQAPIRYSIALADPVTITAPAQQGYTSDPYPTFSGNGEPGATIQVKGNSGKVIASATVKADGTWTAQSTVLLIPGHYLGTVSQNANGTVSNATFDYTNVLALTVSSPAIGGTVSGPRPTYTGTGEAGSTVQVKGNSGKVVAETIVQADGTWSAVAQFDLVPGHYLGTANQFTDDTLINRIAMDYLVS